MYKTTVDRMKFNKKKYFIVDTGHKTKMRNNLNSDYLNILMNICINGTEISKFSF